MIDAVVAALEAGAPVLLPTDTVYGLAANPRREEYARRLYALKGRAAEQPTALVAADVGVLVELVPELRGAAEDVARALLPGPYTLVFPNPRRRFPWLGGSRADTIGVRVPALDGEVAAVLARVGAVMATSANLPGGPDPRRLDDVPAQIRSACAGELDAGELPGTPSTVLDLTGDEPRVLREGAVPGIEAVACVRAAAGGGAE